MYQNCTKIKSGRGTSDPSGLTPISVFSFQYYAESHGVIYVIDSTDEERLSESKRAFGKYSVNKLSWMVVSNKTVMQEGASGFISLSRESVPGICTTSRTG